MSQGKSNDNQKKTISSRGQAGENVEGIDSSAFEALNETVENLEDTLKNVQD